MKRRGSRIGDKEEKYLFDLLREAIPDLALTTNSGATNGDKDFGNQKFLIEAKSTIKDSYSVKKTLLQSVDSRAYDMGKLPVLSVLLDSKDPKEENSFLVIPMEFGLELLEMWNGKEEAEEECKNIQWGCPGGDDCPCP
jgi:hypothetical protein